MGGVGKMGRWGDGAMGRWGDGAMGRWGVVGCMGGGGGRLEIRVHTCTHQRIISTYCGEVQRCLAVVIGYSVESTIEKQLVN